MKIDFSQKISNLKGEPIKGGTEDITLAFVCVESLLANYPDEQALPRSEKLKRGKMAEKIFGQAVVDVAIEEVAIMQQLIAKAYGPLIVLKTDAIFEGQ